ncbi:MAG: carboxypeptidase regulatory-like domain-containing protein [Acidobacteria bacterium]|nr:carboxypeptidase regulatory-like domain-containing protein [Acidobacteriota bacterium]MBI3656253.1 carboxypeptidase regulatory-like domain-containing protein [Acidobacteriota bacterium]
MRRLGTLFVILFVSLTYTAPAQTPTAKISGVVRDSSGAVVMGTRVSASQEATGIAAHTASNATGLYVFPALAPGLYTVTAELEGFKRFVSEHNRLEVGADLEISIILEPGAISETVTVTESYARVQTTESSLSNMVDNRMMETLPLNGRNPLHLMALQPGVVGHSSQATGSGGTTTFYVNGDRGRGIYTTQDGIDISDPVIPRGELTNVMVNPDALAEYRMVSSNAKAEFGRNSGGQVELVTRSGTNEFHGGLFWFHRNTALNANDFFNNARGVAREVLLRHQFGGSLGGPIIRNRAFFFFNYQGQRLSQSVPDRFTVLTKDARQGLFRWVPEGNTPNAVDEAGNPRGPVQVYNILQSSGLGLDPRVQQMLGLTELPNDFSTGDGLNTARYRWNVPSTNPQDSYVTKIDYTLNDRHRLFGRYSWGTNRLIGDIINGAARMPKVVPGRVRNSSTAGLAFGLTSTFGNAQVNEFNAGFTRNVLAFLDPTNPGTTQIVMNLSTDPYRWWNGTGRKPTQFQFGDNFSLVRGPHTWKFGLVSRFYRIDQFRNVGYFPEIRFGTADAPMVLPNEDDLRRRMKPEDFNRLRSLYNDVLGIIGRIDQTFYSDGQRFPGPQYPFLLKQRQQEWNGFVQDDWRAHRRLTLNVGLRYEFNTVPYDKGGLQVVNDRPLDGSQGPVRFVKAGPGTGRQWFKNDLNNFAPIFGFAWDPLGDQKTAIRGGYRVSYNRLVNWALNVVEQRQPGTSVLQRERPNSDGQVHQRAADVPESGFNLRAPLAIDPLVPDNRVESPFVFDANLRTPYVQQWNLSIQRDLGHNTVLEIAYVGNKGSKLFRHYNANQVDVFKNGFIAEFRAAQDNLKDFGNPIDPRGRPTGNFGKLLATYDRGIPFLNDIRLGNVGVVISTLDTGTFSVVDPISGERRTVVGGRLLAAGLPMNFFRNPQFSIGGVGCTCSNSTYHAFQIQLQRRFKKGLQYTVNYTLAKSLDDASEDTQGAGTSIIVPPDSRNFRYSHGRSDFDVRHVLRSMVIYDVPFFKAQSSWYGKVLGGWQVNGIVDLSSGFPFTVSSGYQTFTVGVDSRADYAGASPNIGGVRRQNGSIVFFTADERAQFDRPQAGELGRQGRNVFTGPKFVQFDMGVFKSLALAREERIRMDLRLEIFNLFNNVNFVQPNATKSSPAFGTIDGTRVPPRIMQVALKLYF